MNKLLAGTGLGAALVTLGVYLVQHFQALLTPEVLKALLEITLCAVGATVACWGISWGWTALYRKVWAVDLADLTPLYSSPMTKAEREAEDRAAREQVRYAKGRIYLHAVVSGLLAELAAGYVAWWLLGLPGGWLGPFVVTWALWGGTVAGTSPLMWRVVFEWLVPRALGRAVEGRYDAAGNLIGAKDLTEPDAKTRLFRTPDPPPGPKP